VEPTDSELIHAWVTLQLLRDQSIAGAVRHRGFDTFTACGQAQQTIETVLSQREPGWSEAVWDALAERKAELHA
jgi:hypothetical protein